MTLTADGSYTLKQNQYILIEIFRNILNLDLHQTTFSNFVATYRIQIRLDVSCESPGGSLFPLKLQIFLNVNMFKYCLIPRIHHMYHFTFVYLCTVENLTHLIHTS